MPQAVKVTASQSVQNVVVSAEPNLIKHVCIRWRLSTQVGLCSLPGPAAVLCLLWHLSHSSRDPDHTEGSAATYMSVLPGSLPCVYPLLCVEKQPDSQHYSSDCHLVSSCCARQAEQNCAGSPFIASCSLLFQNNLEVVLLMEELRREESNQRPSDQNG